MTLVHLGIMPKQWKTARIILLRKSQKPDYIIVGAYCPISLLATLGKMFQSIITQKLAFLANKYSLLH